ncbi:PTS sugar transporter subunit IIB [Leifsonia poae]|uniref:PTS lactose transporter subunit IIB n=1 Tax=Leifsonia poae TaxID=110933 RepID=A0A9W6H9J3_9MICO|nr:PTS IIB subunit [Leifsonia poae]GLJ75939.1 PTS lactose transporter subunit IIB [Leifsonia poae]
MKILVVCGAGASSTFVALKVRKAAGLRGIPVTVVAGSADQLETFTGVDVVLVGAHLAPGSSELRERAAAAGAAVAVLPAVSPAALDGDLALDLALDAGPVREHDGTMGAPTAIPSHTEGVQNG